MIRCLGTDLLNIARRLTILGALLFTTTAPLAAAPQPTAQELDERFGAVAASALLHIGRSIRYTDQQPSSFSVCSIGEDSVVHALKKLPADTRVRGVPTSFEYFESGELTTHQEELRSCNLLYIGMSVTKTIGGVSFFGKAPLSPELVPVTQFLHGAPVLMVTSAEPVYQLIGGVRLMNEANRLRLRVAQNSLTERKLTLSSDVLELAYLD